MNSEQVNGENTESPMDTVDANINFAENQEVVKAELDNLFIFFDKNLDTYSRYYSTDGSKRSFEIKVKQAEELQRLLEDELNKRSEAILGLDSSRQVAEIMANFRSIVTRLGSSVDISGQEAIRIDDKLNYIRQEIIRYPSPEDSSDKK